MLCTHKTTFSASLDYFVTSSPPYLHQFSTISGGNCIKSSTPHRPLDLLGAAPEDPYMELLRSLELGKLVSQSTSQFLASGCSWSRFVTQARHRACLDEHVGSLPHSAAAYLHQLQSQGAPVRCTSPAWTQQRKDYSMQRGLHPSTAPYLHFVEDDMADMICKGYWIVLPYHLVRHLPNLRISPMGAGPYHNASAAPVSLWTTVFRT